MWPAKKRGYLSIKPRRVENFSVVFWKFPQREKWPPEKSLTGYGWCNKDMRQTLFTLLTFVEFWSMKNSFRCIPHQPQFRIMEPSQYSKKLHTKYILMLWDSSSVPHYQDFRLILTYVNPNAFWHLWKIFCQFWKEISSKLAQKCFNFGTKT